MITKKRAFFLLFILITLMGAGTWYYKTSHLSATESNEPSIGLPALTTDKAVIFDLNGVLFAVNQQQAITHLGFLDMIAYTTVQGKNISDLQDKVIDVLDNIRDQFESPHCKAADNQSLIPLVDGRPMPHCMRDWMQGELSADEILDKVLPHVQSLDEEYFSCRQEKVLVKKTLQLLFDPNMRSMMYHPIKSGLQLVKLCKQAGHQVYLLSNMDVAFMDRLKTKYPEIFSLFDGMIVSAEAKAIKPYNQIYQQFLTSYALNPSNCYLIDDQEENLEGAKRMGIQGIHCNDKDFSFVKKELKRFNLLPDKKREIAGIQKLEACPS